MSARNLLLWLTASLLAIGVATAQDERARVQGLITDPMHAVIAGASVTLHNNGTGVDAVKKTDANGQYIFDLVDPGTYTLTVELAGFDKFVQQNVLVQVRGDVTVDAALKVGTVGETVTVSAAVTGLQFNTSTMEQTVSTKMLSELPVMQRNPFTLALLDPAVVNRYANLAQRYPFYMWGSSELDVGGSTSTQNDLLLDGAPIQITVKGSYNLPMDAVSQFSVQQNSVDAEFGHSAGGTLSIGMKSGTNEFHGTAYYFGRNPALNAVTDSVTHTPNEVRNNIWGGTLGNPILKNKLFAFTAYEQWHVSEPFAAIMTLPTALERTGDFSQSLNSAGALRTIYDPMTTQYSASGVVTRTPFPGNIIPQNRMDPTSLRFLKDIWLPNGPGDNETGVNNYKTEYTWSLKYLNISERVDWNINDKWKLFARYSRFHTHIDQNNFTPNDSPAMQNGNGGTMYSQNVAGDATYIINSSTVLNFGFSYDTLNDDYDAPSAQIGAAGLANFWPNNPWYQPYVTGSGLPQVYYPKLNITSYGSASFGMGTWWYQHPQTYNSNAKISKHIGRHDLKIGGETRFLRGSEALPNLMDFNFGPALTANTFLSPNTALSGDGWATFLLGALGSDSNASAQPLVEPRTNFYALYVQDDIKLTRKLTINLGLRYEHETGIYDAQNRVSRYLDLTNPIPQMQSSPPPIPASVTALLPSPYIFNGAWVFADSKHPNSFNTNPHTFAPRIGLAYRLNDGTVVRAGYARYVVPPILSTDYLDNGHLLYSGYSATSTVAPILQGVPQAFVSNPFPSTNPLILPSDKTLGRYTNLGRSATWAQQNYQTAVNDRFNFSIQRKLPASIQADVTFFMNVGHNLPYSDLLNMLNPNLIYNGGGPLLNQTVANPFYQYMTPETFPGPLRNQPTVTVGSLLTRYPQYGTLTQQNTSGIKDRYEALQVKLQRNFARGLMFLAAYNYNHEKTTNFFNDINQYYSLFSWIPSSSPRHRLSVTGIYDLPFGRDRQYLTHLPAVLNAVLGGWSTSSLLLFNSGDFLRFGAMLAGNDPTVPNPTRREWFNTANFAVLPPYTPRTNPWQYPNLTGPAFWELDSTLSKVFPITERFRLEFRIEAYNLTNSFEPNDPVLNVTSSSFGSSTDQANRGREMQYTLRLHF